MQGAARIASLAQTIDLVTRGDPLIGDTKEMQANGVQAIEIEIEDLDVPCLCYGTHEIMFYSGEEVVFRLNYKHFSRIRGIGENKAFFGEYDLTKESAAAFASWFEKNGFPDFQKAIAEQEAELRAEQERARRVAAMFPENIRAIIPDYGNALQDWKRFESHKKQVMSAISAAKNRTEILRTCWRAIGDEYSTVSDPEDYEPVATIFMLLAATSTEERNRTLLNAADNDVLLYQLP